MISTKIRQDLELSVSVALSIPGMNHIGTEGKFPEFTLLLTSLIFNEYIFRYLIVLSN